MAQAKDDDPDEDSQLSRDKDRTDEMAAARISLIETILKEHVRQMDPDTESKFRIELLSLRGQLDSSKQREERDRRLGKTDTTRQQGSTRMAGDNPKDHEGKHRFRELFAQTPDQGHVRLGTVERSGIDVPMPLHDAPYEAVEAIVDDAMTACLPKLEQVIHTKGMSESCIVGADSKTMPAYPSGTAGQ